MWIDAPNIDNIWAELNRPVSQEVASLESCEHPDFQTQFDELVSQTRKESW